MKSEQIIQELERYRSDLSGIMGRFVRRPNSYNINREDDPRYRSFILEIIDLLNDCLGKNKYSLLINQIFNEGISNYLQTPSYKSIEDIISVIDSVITRLKRNPDFYVKRIEPTTENQQIQTELPPPEKVTLKWLWEHVSYSIWGIFFGLLLSAFTLGVTFANTNLYKSALSLLTPNSNTNVITPTVK